MVDSPALPCGQKVHFWLIFCQASPFRPFAQRYWRVWDPSKWADFLMFPQSRADNCLPYGDFRDLPCRAGKKFWGLSPVFGVASKNGNAIMVAHVGRRKPPASKRNRGAAVTLKSLQVIGERIADAEQAKVRLTRHGGQRRNASRRAIQASDNSPGGVGSAVWRVCR